jgi:hypothetical protein
MTTEQRLIAVVQAIGVDIKELRTRAGSLAALSTTEKSSLVSALNELYIIANGAYEINDAALSGSTTKTYSASKITTLITAAKNEILGGASSAFDTLLELQNAIGADGTAISGLLTAVGTRVDFGAAQSLTAGQQLQACTNIGIGNPDRNFVTDYTTARDS